ncbi:MAG: patatin-like phospholipase family protein, partial [Defluviitaleaceae bacterium]|nr:patatin-like phospholipase family protein [Defluviitaleaceae bacterium]
MPKIGIVLSGGFAKGAYQIGILKAIREFFTHDQFSCISASSVGALNAYAFMVDKIGFAEDIWKNIDFKGFRKFLSIYVGSSYIDDAIS